MCLIYNESIVILYHFLVDTDDGIDDAKSVRSIRTYVSRNIPGSPGALTSSASDAITEQKKHQLRERQAHLERLERFW